MKKIFLRKKLATQDYDVLFNAVESFACKKLGVSSLSEMMLEFTKEAIKSGETNKDKILMSAKFESSDFLQGIGLAAIENDDEAKKIIQQIKDPSDLLANVEAQVLVKAHSNENMKASEEYVDSLNLEKAASLLDCRTAGDSMAKLKKFADNEKKDDRCYNAIRTVHEEVQSLQDVLAEIDEFILEEGLSKEVILEEFRNLYKTLKKSSESLEIAMEDTMKIADLFD